MRDVLDATLFREPEGWRSGALWLVLSAGLFVYAAVLSSRGDADLTVPIVLGTSFACLGAAESLPPVRRTAVGLLRSAGVLVGGALLFVVF